MAMGESTLTCLERLVGDQWKRSVVGLILPFSHRSLLLRPVRPGDALTDAPKLSTAQS